MALTRKHFEEFASIIADQYIEALDADRLYRDIVNLCQRENVNFDSRKFSKRIDELIEKRNKERRISPF